MVILTVHKAEAKHFVRAIDATLQGTPLHEVDDADLHTALQLWGNPSREVKI
ncbi:hypothetical protein ACUC2M_10060 [Bacillus cytotoxicus]